MAVDNEMELRWQRAAHRAVGDFLAAATALNLPAITWTIAVTGAVTGAVGGLGRTPEEQRATVEAWARYFNLPVAEYVRRDGSVTLTVRFKTETLVGGVIRADIYPPMGDEDAS
ncbi:hypothetical protein ABZ636_03840 [Streptomyces sp. NPDC007251]|uniref:hypothetical protein n=1 Tax=Streptomyces sp. NPDC007251 TaxID=3154483 RepID=UPI0033F24E79